MRKFFSRPALILMLSTIGIMASDSAAQIVKNVKFARGKSSITIRSHIVSEMNGNGSYHSYRVGAKAGQIMRVRVTDGSNDSRNPMLFTISIVGSKDKYGMDEVLTNGGYFKNWSVRLPKTAIYEIEVSAARDDNAAVDTKYALTVGITNSATAKSSGMRTAKTRRNKSSRNVSFSPNAQYVIRFAVVHKDLMSAVSNLTSLLSRQSSVSSTTILNAIDAVRRQGNRLEAISPVPPTMKQASFDASTANIAIRDAMTSFELAIANNDSSSLNDGFFRLRVMNAHLTEAKAEMRLSGAFDEISRSP